MSNRLGILLIPAVTLMVTLAAQTAMAQESEHRKSVWDGVFTVAQAERGKEAYGVHCSSCHMEDLAGLAGPALKGEQFMENWREDSLKSLFTFIQTSMPANRARGSLSEETYLDILAHILSVNMFPAGPKELSTDALGGIEVVGKGGPAPIPKFALVAMVGCLAKTGDEWKLENASSPIRTRQEKPTAPEVQASAPSRQAPVCSGWYTSIRCAPVSCPNATWGTSCMPRVTCLVMRRARA